MVFRVRYRGLPYCGPALALPNQLGATLIGALGLGFAGPLAGCSTAVEGDAGRDGPACADGFEVTEQSARVGPGQVPEVWLRVRNDGTVTVDYELVVVFEQGTSLGIDARTGRDVLSGDASPSPASGLAPRKAASVDASVCCHTNGGVKRSAGRSMRGGIAARHLNSARTAPGPRAAKNTPIPVS
jgi:hypothetical protein